MARVVGILVLVFGLLHADKPVVEIITINGVINPVSQDFIHRSIERAAEDSAQCLIIQLDTPGGLMKSMRIITKDLLSAPVPVVVYVAPPGARAASAGVFVTMAAHIAAMAPGTNIGAASPITMGMGGDTTQSKTLLRKVTNDAVAFIKSIAEQRGRNADWAEKAVREAASITEKEALALNVVDYIAPTLDSLLALIDGDTVQTAVGRRILHTQQAQKVFIKTSFRYRVLDIISDPNVAYILLLIGIYGIFFELLNPGAILPGVVGAICLILAFFALQTLPVNYAGLLLILLSLILFLLEVKIPSYGLLTVSGIISLVLGSLMLFDSPVPMFKVSWKLIAAASVTTALFFIFAVGMGIRAQRKKPATGREGLVGLVGEALETFQKGRGQVLVEGEIWQAYSDNSVRKGDKIRVVAMEGLTLKIERVNGSHTEKKKKS
ncbi:MAG: nodulation protein NfeD [Calditrichaeota bacterium]|nr:MAG: nodulation protein NfeD [Calditrichota bacterium]